MPALFYGLIASMFALVLQLLVWIPYPAIFTLQASFGASTLIALCMLASCEEGTRILFFTQYAKRYSITSPLLNGFVFGLGFAITEATLALYQPFSFLIFGAALLHIALSILLAYASQKYLFRPAAGYLFFGLMFVVATLLHIGYNTAIFLLT